MSKAVLTLSLFGIGLLFVFGLTNPDSPVMWMASTSINFAIVRAVLITVLVALIITNPPRNVHFRYFVGIFSAILTSWALNATYNNEMQILDTLSILEFSVCAGLIVLERSGQGVLAKKKQGVATK